MRIANFGVGGNEHSIVFYRTGLEGAGGAQVGASLIEAGLTTDIVSVIGEVLSGGSLTPAMVITAAAGAAARAILDEYGIDINDAENGVFLPTESGHGTATIHTGRHTNAYMREVTKALTNANPQSKSKACKPESGLQALSKI